MGYCNHANNDIDGDTQADIMAGAFEQIIQAFQNDWDRPPTRSEMRSIFETSMGSFDEDLLTEEGYEEERGGYSTEWYRLNAEGRWVMTAQRLGGQTEVIDLTGVAGFDA